MFGHQLQDDDTEELVAIDSSLLEQVDQRLGNAFLTRESLIHSALQHYIAHIDEAASKDSIHKMSLKPSYHKKQPSYT